MSTSAECQFPAGDIFDGLVRYSSDMTPLPDLATSWTESDDGLTYTFDLVDNATWHDGEPVTSADVKFTFEQVISKYQSRVGSIYSTFLDNISTPDEYTVVFHLKEVFPPFMRIVGWVEEPILPQHLLDPAVTGIPIEQNDEYNQAPIGSGPFMFEEWVHGDHVTLVRNPNYFVPEYPYLDSVIIRIITDPTARLNAFKTGELDVLVGGTLAESSASSLEGPGVTLVNGQGTGVAFYEAAEMLMFNLHGPEHDEILDVNVRRAIAHALDKDWMVENIMFGFSQPAWGPIGTGNPFHNPEVTNDYPYDLTEANRILDSAGYAKGSDGVRFTLTMRFATDKAMEEPLAQYLQAQLREIGISAEISGSPMTTKNNLCYVEYSYDICATEIGTGPDPSISVARFYETTNIKDVPYDNGAGYSNPVVDELIREFSTTVGDSARQPIIFEFQKVVQEDLPYLFLFTSLNVAAYHNNIHGMFDQSEFVWDRGIFFSVWKDEAT
jgi:peptide/nickel transport system substrate-binding protein